MLLKAAMHIADISNPSKPNGIAVYWAECVTREFFEQCYSKQLCISQTYRILPSRTASLSTGLSALQGSSLSKEITKGSLVCQFLLCVTVTLPIWSEGNRAS